MCQTVAVPAYDWCYAVTVKAENEYCIMTEEGGHCTVVVIGERGHQVLRADVVFRYIHL